MRRIVVVACCRCSLCIHPSSTMASRKRTRSGEPVDEVTSTSSSSSSATSTTSAGAKARGASATKSRRQQREEQAQRASKSHRHDDDDEGATLQEDRDEEDFISLGSFNAPSDDEVDDEQHKHAASGRTAPRMIKLATTPAPSSSSTKVKVEKSERPAKLRKRRRAADVHDKSTVTDEHDAIKPAEVLPSRIKAEKDGATITTIEPSLDSRKKKYIRGTPGKVNVAVRTLNLETNCCASRGWAARRCSLIVAHLKMMLMMLARCRVCATRRPLISSRRPRRASLKQSRVPLLQRSFFLLKLGMAGSLSLSLSLSCSLDLSMKFNQWSMVLASSRPRAWRSRMLSHSIKSRRLLTCRLLARCVPSW